LIGIVSLVSSAEADDIAFTHVTVIDTVSGRERRNITVVVHGDKLAEVSPTGSVKLPAQMRKVDASGKYLIPGLWDMHAHGTADNLVAIPAFVANGIAGVRSMGEDFDGVQTIRQEIASGKVVGPRILASGKVLDGPNPVRPSVSIPVSNAAEARQL
jgi:predicted amidohydrolase YtcJ